MTLTPHWEQLLVEISQRLVALHESIRVLAEHDAETTCRRCGKRCQDDGVPECSSCLEAGDGPAEQPAPTPESILAAAENYRRVWHGGDQHDETCATRTGTSRNCDCREQPAPMNGYCTRCKEDVVIDGHKCPPWRGVCACNAGDPVFHSHYREEPHKCARCSECNAFHAEAQPEPAQAAPDGGRLSDELHGWADLTFSPRTSDIRRVAYRVAALEAKLARSERLYEHADKGWVRTIESLERQETKSEELAAKLAAAERDVKQWMDEAADRLGQIASERARFLELLETYEPRRDVPSDWSYQGALERIAAMVRELRSEP